MRLRLDPWAAEYQTAFQAETLLGPGPEGADLAVEVEPADWRPIDPQQPAGPEEILFLDGSRRVEMRILLEDDSGRITFGALGSFGVGAVVCKGGMARCHPLTIDRICALGGRDPKSPDLGQLELTMDPVGTHHLGSLRYRIVNAAGHDSDAVVRQLQAEMLGAERRLASELVAEYRDALVISDGPRPLLSEESNLLGYIKTIHEVRVPSEQLDVVRQLERGQRSPLYLVRSSTPQQRLFEWFVRLRDPKPWYYSLAGVVRLQAFAGADPAARLEAAKAVADWSCLELPRYATRQHQDLRAPQQLLPVRALEAELRRRMGSVELVRRRITAYLARQGAQA